MASRFDERYAPNWNKKSAATRKATGGYCCFPDCWNMGKAAHHALYMDKRGSIAGREIPGVHTFLLCLVHHGRRSKNGAHHPDNWNAGGLPPPTLDARNSVDYYLKLREGFKQKQRLLENVNAC